jgi:hypothetical protein
MFCLWLKKLISMPGLVRSPIHSSLCLVLSGHLSIHLCAWSCQVTYPFIFEVQWYARQLNILTNWKTTALIICSIFDTLRFDRLVSEVSWVKIWPLPLYGTSIDGSSDKRSLKHLILIWLVLRWKEILTNITSFSCNVLMERLGLDTDRTQTSL